MDGSEGGSSGDVYICLQVYGCEKEHKERHLKINRNGKDKMRFVSGRGRGCSHDSDKQGEENTSTTS